MAMQTKWANKHEERKAEQEEIKEKATATKPKTATKTTAAKPKAAAKPKTAAKAKTTTKAKAATKTKAVKAKTSTTKAAKEEEDLIRISFLAPKDLRLSVKKKCLENGDIMSDVIRKSLENYIKA